MRFSNEEQKRFLESDRKEQIFKDPGYYDIKLQRKDKGYVDFLVNWDSKINKYMYIDCVKDDDKAFKELNDIFGLWIKFGFTGYWEIREGIRRMKENINKKRKILAEIQKTRIW